MAAVHWCKCVHYDVPVYLCRWVLVWVTPTIHSYCSTSGLLCTVCRHLIPLLMKEGSVGLVGFYAALLAASMEHPGHTVLVQKLRQESEAPCHTAECTCVPLTFCMLWAHHLTLRISKYPYGSSSLSLTYVRTYVRTCTYVGAFVLQFLFNTGLCYFQPMVTIDLFTIDFS